MTKLPQETGHRKPEDTARTDASHGVERWPTTAETETLHAAGFHYDPWRAYWIDSRTDRGVTLAHALELATKDLERRAAGGL